MTRLNDKYSMIYTVNIYFIYLLVINIISFLMFTIDFLYCVKTGREELFSHIFLSLSAVVGGGVGMLLAFLIWDRRVNKDNVAWRMIAIIGIILWTLITLYVCNIVDIGPLDTLLAPINPGILISLGIYLITLNIATFVIFAYDKWCAMHRKSRIPEFILLILSLFGGAIGGYLAMGILRHKIRTWYFAVGLPFMIVLQVILIVYLRLTGVF